MNKNIKILGLLGALLSTAYAAIPQSIKVNSVSFEREYFLDLGNDPSGTFKLEFFHQAEEKLVPLQGNIFLNEDRVHLEGEDLKFYFSHPLVYRINKLNLSQMQIDRDLNQLQVDLGQLDLNLYNWNLGLKNLNLACDLLQESSGDTLPAYLDECFKDLKKKDLEDLEFSFHYGQKNIKGKALISDFGMQEMGLYLSLPKLHTSIFNFYFEISNFTIVCSKPVNPFNGRSQGITTECLNSASVTNADFRERMLYQFYNPQFNLILEPDHIVISPSRLKTWLNEVQLEIGPNKLNIAKSDTLDSQPILNCFKRRWDFSGSFVDIFNDCLRSAYLHLPKVSLKNPTENYGGYLEEQSIRSDHRGFQFVGPSLKFYNPELTVNLQEMEFKCRRDHSAKEGDYTGLLLGCLKESKLTFDQMAICGRPNQMDCPQDYHFADHKDYYFNLKNKKLIVSNEHFEIKGEQAGLHTSMLDLDFSKIYLKCSNQGINEALWFQNENNSDMRNAKRSQIIKNLAKGCFNDSKIDVDEVNLRYEKMNGHAKIRQVILSKDQFSLEVPIVKYIVNDNRTQIEKGKGSCRPDIQFDEIKNFDHKSLLQRCFTDLKLSAKKMFDPDLGILDMLAFWDTGYEALHDIDLSIENGKIKLSLEVDLKPGPSVDIDLVGKVTLSHDKHHLQLREIQAYAEGTIIPRFKMESLLVSMIHHLFDKEKVNQIDAESFDISIF